MKDIVHIEDIIDHEDIDDDELDLLELVSADTNITNQYLVFIGSDDEAYAMNVSKIRELLVYKDLDVVKKNKKNSLIRAAADIRGNMVSIINFDEWFENKVLSDEMYELIILAGFGGRNFGIMIKSVEYIVNINSSNMQDSSSSDSKTNFVAKIKLNGNDTLCTIFDGDKMLLDVFDMQSKELSIENVNVTMENNIDKYVLFADDSKFIRTMVSSLFEKMNLKALIFDDGEQLYNKLISMNPEDIGLIITDLEMPIMDGNTLIKKIRELNIYDHIDILVHTNMSNDIMKENLLKIGANDVIGKIDMLKLSESVKNSLTIGNTINAPENELLPPKT